MTVKKKYRLSGMAYDEISFVEEGANRDAHIVLCKSANQGHLEKTGPLSGDLHITSPNWGLPKKKRRKKLMGSRGNTAFTRNISCPTCNTKMSVAKNAEEECSCGVIVKNTGNGVPISTVYAGIMKAVLDLGSALLETVDAEDVEKSDFGTVIQEFADEVAKSCEEWVEVGTDGEFYTAVPADVEKSLYAAYEELGELFVTEGPVRKSKKRMRVVKARPDSDDAPSALSELAKSLDGAAGQELEALLAKSRANEAELAKIAEEKELERWVAKVSGWKYLPGKPEDTAAQLRAVEKSAGAEAANNFAAQMAAANNVASQSDLFRSRGSSMPGKSGGLGSIEAIVKEAVSKSGGKLTEAQAWEKALEEDPSLYTQYLSAQ